MEHTRVQGFSMRGFPAKLEGEEGEEQFWFEGGSDADQRVRVEIQGAWLHNLPWDRAGTQIEERITPERISASVPSTSFAGRRIGKSQLFE
jgi:hypothetical protein